MECAGAAAVVTGGASGLGLATARLLVDDGAKVVIVDLPSSDGAAIAEELGDAVAFSPADVTDEDAVVGRRWTSPTSSGRCASRSTAPGSARPSGCSASDGSPADLDWFATSSRSTWSARSTCCGWRRRGWSPHDPVGEERGVIVNTASAAAFDGQIGQAAYSASKGGVVGMTLPLARDLAQGRSGP